MSFTNAPVDQGCYSALQPVITLLNGGPSSWANMTGIDDDTNPALAVTNAGTGGAARFIGGVNIDALTVAGLLTANSLAVTTSATIGTTLGVTGISTLGVVSAGATTVTTLHATGSATLDSTLSAGATSVSTLTASSTVQGTRLISTVAAPTAPLTVASQILVTNLNADMVDGLHASSFLTTTTGDARYLQLTGGTLTGQLTIQANQGLKLQNSGSAGIFSLNSTNVADPVLEFKDASGDTTVTIGNSSSTYQLDVTSDAHVADDLTVDGDISGGRIVASGTTFSGAEELRVVGQSRLEGQAVVTTGGVSVTGSSTFNDGVSFGNGINITAGSSVIAASVTFSGSGTPFLFTGSSQTASTVGAAGGASALPATPLGYLKATIGGTDVKFPYYNA